MHRSLFCDMFSSLMLLHLSARTQFMNITDRDFQMNVEIKDTIFQKPRLTGY